MNNSAKNYRQGKNPHIFSNVFEHYSLYVELQAEMQVNPVHVQRAQTSLSFAMNVCSKVCFALNTTF